MVKKKLGSGSSTKEVLSCPSTSSSWSSTFAWQWPSCGQPRTLSFREEQQQQQAYYKIMNSAYCPIADSFEMVEAEAVICALRSDRLFFEPDNSSCIFNKQPDSKLIEEEEEEDKKKKMVAFGGATAMSVESQHPYRDFRESMEAMVMSHGGVKDWSWLEEMLGWYLKANAKSTHGLIVGAFVDLLVSLSNTTSSSSSPANSSDDECSSSL